MKFLFATTIFMLLLGIDGSFVSSTLQDGTGNFADVCPYRNFCTSLAQKNYTDPSMTSCCQKCSCQRNCHEVGTCCPDMPGIEGLEPKYKCRDIADFYHKPGYIFKTDTYFRVVDDCPNDTMINEYPRCVNTTHLDDFIMVSDLQDERIYRNRHCARCHGISEFVSWSAHVKRCNDMMYERFSSFEERDQYIFANCAVLSAPPKAGIGEMSRCFWSYEPINYCQHSTMNSMLTSLGALCNTTRATTSTLFYREYGSTFKQVYPNIFCYFCEANTISNDRVCAVNDYNISEKSSVVSLTALLFGPENLNEERGDNDCGMTSIWDPYSATCRPFYCPLGTIPAGKRCQSTFQSVEGVALSLFVTVAIPPDYFYYASNISRTVNNILEHLINQDSVPCELCNRMFLKSNESDSEIFVEFPLFSTNRCSVRDIIKKARFLMSKGTIGFQMPLEDHTVNIRFQLAIRQHFREVDSDIVLDVQKGKLCLSAKPLAKWMLLDCPHFKLRSDSLETLGLDTEVQKKLIRKTAMITFDDSSDVAICVTDYFSIRSSISSVHNYFANVLLVLSVLLTCQWYSVVIQ